MPLILIIVAVALALGAGFMFMGSDSEVTTPTARVEETTPVTETASTDTNSETSVITETTPTESSDSAYTDGQYDATASYSTPGRSTHTVTASFTLAGDVVTASAVTFGGDDNTTSTGLQNKFAAAFQAQVVGKKLDDISLSRVGGASLTTGAFNKALAEVKVKAQ